MIKFRKKLLCVIFLFCLSMQTSCGKHAVTQNTPTEQKNSGETNTVWESPYEHDPSQPLEEGGIFLHRGDWLTSAGIVDQTWTKNYDSAEWENTPCLYLYIHFPDADNLDFSVFEDELNHRLHMAGYDFHVHLLLSPYEEYFRVEQAAIMEHREEELGITIDLYLTNDYLSAVQNQEILDLSDYLAEQEDLYGHYNESVWEQLRDSKSRIYGIPTNPIAAGKLGYAYNPQLASLLSIDMTDFKGDPATLESYFPTMLEEEIKPLRLFLMPEDYLMLSLAGLETYGDIFAVRHDGENWEAIDLLQEEEMTDFYIQLGEWMEKGYLCYSDIILSQFDQMENPMNFGQYRYCFLQLQNHAAISWAYDVNMADEGGFLETDFFIPDQPAYIYEKMNSEIMVINVKTGYPEECMEFLRLLTLDEDIRLLLYSGIEGYNYMWENDIQIFDPQNGAFATGLGLENDMRFWPVEHFSDMYTTQIEDLNADVRVSASLQHPFDPAEMEEYYETCKQLFEENILVFLGYYGAETETRLAELHEQLIDAGYLELIDAINAER
ncbi:MAG: hypothetical protein HDR21_06460 [Lachnospiraceae bacterium]|nr:hypothetical protein [Lachnospiraceae bacterium]